MSLAAQLAPLARASIKGTAAAVDLVSRPSHGITILIYHRVGAGAGGQMDLPVEVFDAQLEWLARTQRVLSLDAAVDELSGSGPVAPGVVVSFDDGTTDWVDHVLPALHRHRVPATFYVATSFVDQGLALPGDGRPLDWAGVRELAASDLVTVGSHTHGHLLLDRLSPSEVDAELDRSIELLHDRAGVDAEHFAYPKAVAGSPAADAAVRRRFRSAVLAGTRSNPTGTDPYRLHRSPVQAADGMGWFRRKVRGGMHVEDDLRRGLNRIRYRHLTT